MIELYLAVARGDRHRPRKHDIKFEEDNWESPTLGAWGIGWQVMLDGLEITQFTYFQQCGGVDLDLVPAELTYGLERLIAFLQGVESVYDIEWAPGVKYGDVRFADELQYSVYNFELADVEMLWKLFELHEGEAQRLLWLSDPKYEPKARFPLLATYDHVLKCSNYFNLLDARGAISVTERVGVIARVRKLAVGVAQAWVDQQLRRGGAHERPFLLEIGVEEVPDWMIEPALADLERLFTQFLETNNLAGEPRPPGSVTTAATPRRLVLKSTGLIATGRRNQNRLRSAVSAGEGAAKGFAKKNSVPFEALVKSTTPKGEYYTLEQKVAGRAAKDLLAEALPGIITGIHWPKTMYWTGKSGPRFIRPIRWIVALLDDQVVPFEIAGVQVGPHHQRPSPPRLAA